MMKPNPIHRWAARALHGTRLSLGLLVLPLLGACATSPRAPEPRPRPLGQVVDSVTSTPPLDRTHWGIEVYDPAARRTVYRLNADRHFIPASNTKMVVTAVALGELGPEYRYRTEILALGVGAEDSIAGSLIIVGRGDPTLSSRFHPTGPTPLEMLADSIAGAGIRRVAGDLVVDASYFDDALINPTWEVGDLAWSYAPPVTAFGIEEGTFRLVLEPGDRPDQPAKVTVLGPEGAVTVRNLAVTDTTGDRRRIDVASLPGANALVMTGTVPLGARPDTMTLAVPDPADYAGRAFVAALEARGITVDGRVRVVYDTLEARALRTTAPQRRVATWNSAPMSEIVAAILQPSQNWIAEQVLKTLGAERAGQGSWRAGLEVERRYLIDVAGIDSTAFSLRDGSGLSAQNLLAPHAIIQILDHARRQPWGEIYVAAMARPGLEDSTLERRLLEYEGRIFAKTGTISNVATLSGYATAANGKELYFSIMTNGTGTPSALTRRGIDRLVHAILGDGGNE